MTKEEILERHYKSHRDFTTFIENLYEHFYLHRHNNEKWDAGQQLEHIRLTTKLMAKAMSLPKFILRMKFGKSNRPSRSFDEVIGKYTKGISQGFKAPVEFIPDSQSFVNRFSLAKKILKNSDAIEQGIRKFSEEELDEYIIPHPALKLMTIRELMYFSMHHVENHLHITKRNLQSLSNPSD